MASEPTYDLYIRDTQGELERLATQHYVIKDEMDKLILAPVDLSKPLRILDSATADGA